MTSISTEVNNYFKLERLIARSNVILRQLFKNRYSEFNGGKEWNDSPSYGNHFLNDIIAKNKQCYLTTTQKTCILKGNSNEWDLTTLTTILLCGHYSKKIRTEKLQEIDRENKFLKQLRDIRNKLAHHPSKSITDTEFHPLWNDLTTILIALGDDINELDKLKDSSLFNSCSQSINEEHVKEAKHFNSLGTQSHKDEKFSEAITYFTKASVLSGVPDHDRAVFFSNMSSSRLALFEQQSTPLFTVKNSNLTDERQRALQDAETARNLWSTWWKGHYRVGKAYASLNEHEKAISSLERALALAPTNEEIKKALYESRDIYSRQSREEHLDPRLKPKGMDEMLLELQQKYGIDPQEVRKMHSILEKTNPTAADVVKGHKCFHGDIDTKQDYEQAAQYFAKAASQGNAEGMYNLARLTERGLGVKKDHNLAQELYEQAAAQSPRHHLFEMLPNIGVVESEHALGLRYAEGIGVHKNLETAAYWYQRAIDHGCASSANNLGLMYLNGEGVEKDLQQAERLFQRSAKNGDPNAMYTLAQFLLSNNDFHMAQIWYNRACEYGLIKAQMKRAEFERTLEMRKNLVNQSSVFSEMVNTMQKRFDSLQTRKTILTISDRPFIYSYDKFNEYANRGSVMGRRFCNALDCFALSLEILSKTEVLTNEEENKIIYELAKCYRIERTVAQLPSLEIHRKLDNIVDRILHRCTTEYKNVISKLDEDVRTCYATLHMESKQLILEFLGPCKEKYPKSIYFFELSAVLNDSLGRHEAVIYDANNGLEIDPNYYELLYFKAAALNQLKTDMDGTVKAYQTFFIVAPKDHPKVPESYYAMAYRYMTGYNIEKVKDIIRKLLKQGEDAEKQQLPCFQPYDSISKRLVNPQINGESLLSTESTTSSVNNQKLDLTDTHRIQVFKQHRMWAEVAHKEKLNPQFYLNPSNHEPRLKQQTTKTLIGLKPILLKEMDLLKDHIYDGHVLSVTIIDEAPFWLPSIHLVVIDENNDCERLFIYNFPESQAEYLVSKVFTIGSKMDVINPYLRIGKNDSQPLIRIDDFTSIIMQNESQRIINMCRCCGRSNASHVCSRCKRARYCSKECQTIDWKLYCHKLICRT